ncbi:MAG: Lipase 2 [Nitrospira sp.]|nr:Lipase 2 [Nitrospira sp.]
MATSTRVVYDPKAKFEIKVFDVTYRTDDDGKEWKLRIYQPQGPGPFPGVIDVHGGQWYAGDRTQNTLIDTELAESGLVVAAVEFRTSTTAPYPAQISDVNLATRWFKAHASELNSMPEGIGFNGTSSGGHTSAMVAMRPDDPRYNSQPLPEGPNLDARVAYHMLLWAVLDPFARYEYGKSVDLTDKALLASGAGMDQIPANSFKYFGTEEGMKEGNPTLAMERAEKLDLPPCLIVQGYPDGNIPRALVWRFQDLYEERGGHIEVEWFVGAPHGFAREKSYEHDRAMTKMKKFIARQVAAVFA